MMDDYLRCGAVAVTTETDGLCINIKSGQLRPPSSAYLHLAFKLICYLKHSYSDVEVLTG